MLIRMKTQLIHTDFMYYVEGNLCVHERIANKLKKMCKVMEIDRSKGIKIKNQSRQRFEATGERETAINRYIFSLTLTPFLTLQ